MKEKVEEKTITTTTTTTMMMMKIENLRQGL